MMTRFIFFIQFLFILSCTNPVTERNNRIKLQLEEIARLDQKYRGKNFDKDKWKQRKLDIVNKKRVLGIIDGFGWLGPNEIGNLANETLFMVIQHSDKSTMEEYLPIMKEATEHQNARKQDLALLIDRVQILNGHPQIYGSQVTKINGKWTYHELIDTISLNKRRAKMGLDSFEKYILKF